MSGQRRKLVSTPAALTKSYPIEGGHNRWSSAPRHPVPIERHGHHRERRYRVPIGWYHVPVAFNVKDEEVIRLADELADRLHLTSRIDAIRHALKAQIEVTQTRTGNRTDELLGVVANEIWPLLNDGSTITKAEREQILGYDPATGV